MSILDLIEKEAKEEGLRVPDQKDLNELTSMLHRMAEKEREVEEKKEELKQLEAELRQLQMIDIPDIFKEMGNVKSLNLSDGRSVEIKDEVSVSIKKARQEEAYAWLRSVGKEEVIKRKFVIEYDKGQDKEALSSAEVLLENGIEFSDTQGVHPSTLKAVVKKLREDGLEIPDCFNHYEYQKTIIK